MEVSFFNIEGRRTRLLSSAEAAMTSREGPEAEHVDT